MKVKELVKEFLEKELYLELSEEKTKITDLRTDRAKFLGTYFHLNQTNEKKVITREARWGKVKSRVGAHQIVFVAPMRGILEKLEDKGFITRDENGGLKPQAFTKWINLDHRSIILRYNEIARGYINYYSFVDNVREVKGVIVNYFLRHSCAATLGRKYKLPSRGAVFHEFGKYLTPKDELTNLTNKKQVQFI